MQTDILIDLETLGTGTDALVTEIGASIFNRETGELDELIDFRDGEGNSVKSIPITITGIGVDDTRIKGKVFSTYHKKLSMINKGTIEVDVATLQFWNKSEHNQKLFQQLIKQDGLEEQELWESFHKWLTEIVKISSGEVKIWGNGISFDVEKMKYNFAKWGLDNPIKFWNERDVRTVVDLASEKLDISAIKFKHCVPNDKAHDALADINWEAKYLGVAYQILMDK